MWSGRSGGSSRSERVEEKRGGKRGGCFEK